jgi:signal recognition particle receptor subunit beta
MALINHAKREINAKIVYYGREGVGKRISLQYLYDRIKPSLRGELKVVPASGDSLLFFDFSPFEQSVFGGYKLRFHMYSLTGRVANPAAWKMTLKGADGLVIVADASPESLTSSRESVSRLRGFLSAYGVALQDLPCVLQINSSGVNGPSSASDIAAELDLSNIQSCHSEAGSGEGVLKALSMLSRDIMSRIGQDDALRSGENRIQAESAQVAEGSAPSAILLETEDRQAAHATVDSVVVEPPAGAGKTGEGEPLCVALSGEGVVTRGTEVRIPLEISCGEVTKRLVISVSIEQV